MPPDIPCNFQAILPTSFDLREKVVFSAFMLEFNFYKFVSLSQPFKVQNKTLIPLPLPPSFHPLPIPSPRTEISLFNQKENRMQLSKMSLWFHVGELRLNYASVSDFHLILFRVARALFRRKSEEFVIFLLEIMNQSGKARVLARRATVRFAQHNIFIDKISCNCLSHNTQSLSRSGVFHRETPLQIMNKILHSSFVYSVFVARRINMRCGRQLKLFLL